MKAPAVEVTNPPVKLIFDDEVRLTPALGPKSITAYFD